MLMYSLSEREDQIPHLSHSLRHRQSRRAAVHCTHIETSIRMSERAVPVSSGAASMFVFGPTITTSQVGDALPFTPIPDPPHQVSTMHAAASVGVSHSYSDSCIGFHASIARAFAASI